MQRSVQTRFRAEDVLLIPPFVMVEKDWDALHFTSIQWSTVRTLTCPGVDQGGGSPSSVRQLSWNNRTLSI